MEDVSWLRNLLEDLSADQIQSFKELREHVSKDTSPMSVIDFVSSHTPHQEAIYTLLKIWAQLSKIGVEQHGVRPALRLSDTGITVGYGHHLCLNDVREMPPSVCAFVFTQLAVLNEGESADWHEIQMSVERSSKMQLIPWIISQTFCTDCPAAVLRDLLFLKRQCSLFDDSSATSEETLATGITLLLPGNAIIEINNHLRISILFLKRIEPVETLRELVNGVRNLPKYPPTQMENWEASRIKKLINKTLRLRLQFQRTESVNKILAEITPVFNEKLVNLQPFELDRLYTICQEFPDNIAWSPAMKKASLNFANQMAPNNVSAFAAYAEFAISKIGMFALDAREENRKTDKDNKRNISKDSTRINGATHVTENFSKFHDVFEALEITANTNQMVGSSIIDSGLDDFELVEEVRKLAAKFELKFGAQQSAAYHLDKHPSAATISNYAKLANEAIQHSENESIGHPIVTINQEGDTRFLFFGCIRMEIARGKVTVMEREGEVVLATFIGTIKSLD